MVDIWQRSRCLLSQQKRLTEDSIHRKPFTYIPNHNWSSHVRVVWMPSLEFVPSKQLYSNAENIQKIIVFFLLSLSFSIAMLLSIIICLRKSVLSYSIDQEKVPQIHASFVFLVPLPVLFNVHLTVTKKYIREN